MGQPALKPPKPFSELSSREQRMIVCVLSAWVEASGMKIKLSMTEKEVIGRLIKMANLGRLKIIPEKDGVFQVYMYDDTVDDFQLEEPKVVINMRDGSGKKLEAWWDEPGQKESDLDGGILGGGNGKA